MDNIINFFFEVLPNVQYGLAPIVVQAMLGAPGLAEQITASKRLERDAGVAERRAGARLGRAQDLLDRARRGDLEYNPFQYTFQNRMGDQLDRTAEDQLAKEREQALATGMEAGGSPRMEKLILGSEDAARKTALEFKTGRDAALQRLGMMETQADTANVAAKNRLLQDQIAQGQNLYTEGFQMQEGAEDLRRSARDAKRDALGNFAKNTLLNSISMPGVSNFKDIFKHMDNPLEAQKKADEAKKAAAKKAAADKAAAEKAALAEAEKMKSAGLGTADDFQAMMLSQLKLY